MATYKNDDWADAWTTNLTTDPAYGAVPTLTVSNGGVGYQADTISTISLTNTTGIGGYTIGGLNGATGSNTVWTTNTTGAGSYRLNDPAAVISASGRMELKGDGADLTINGKSLKCWMEKVEERLTFSHQILNWKRSGTNCADWANAIANWKRNAKKKQKYGTN